MKAVKTENTFERQREAVGLRRLKEAMKAVQTEKYAIRTAANMYNIPKRTLRQRLKTEDSEKKSLGQHPQLTYEVEEKHAKHIIKVQKAGFTPYRKTGQELAFQIATVMQIKTLFNMDKHIASKD